MKSVLTGKSHSVGVRDWLIIARDCPFRVCKTPVVKASDYKNRGAWLIPMGSQGAMSPAPPTAPSPIQSGQQAIVAEELVTRLWKALGVHRTVLLSGV